MFDSWIPISVIIHSPSCHQSCNHGNGMSTVQIRTSIMGSQRFTSIFHWAISPPFRWQSWESRWPKHRSHRLKASSGWATESFWRQLERARRGKDQTDQQRCDFKCSSPTATESHNWVLFTFYFFFFFSNIHKDGEYLMGYNGLYNVIHIIEKNRCWCRIPHSCCADPHSMDAMDPTVSVGLVRHCQPCRREPEDVRCTQQCQRWYILNAKFPNGGVLCKDFMKHDSLKETNDLFSWFPSGKLT